MPKLIVFKGGVETLTFFSQQLVDYFVEVGYEIFWYDLEDSLTSYKRLKRFVNSDTVMLTFNFMGLTQEQGVYEQEEYVWDKWKIPCFNIVVDHPLYYSNHYDQLPKRYYQISIDREHEVFMNMYYPEIKTAGFCPLAGTRISHDDKQTEPENRIEIIKRNDISDVNETVDEWLKQRPIDVLFVGNYKNPQEYEQYITRIDEEYTAFYRGMIADLLAHPNQSLDVVAREHCLREMGEISIEEWRLAFQYLNFIDLYVRFTARERVLKALLDAGITVHIYGTGYEDFETKHPECMILHGGTDSLTCLRQMQKSKISLNVMPWFKDGAHDRIFNAMANGSVSFTDDSVYLRAQLQDKENVVFYDLLNLDCLVDVVEKYLMHPEKLYEIAQNGKALACNQHLWRHRARWILDVIKELQK